jgi:hypothetical protein
MARALQEADFKQLDKNQALNIVFTHGLTEIVHPCKFIAIINGQAHLLVYFTDQPQRKIRWSLITNKPVGEFAGYNGKVRIEIDG